MKKLFIKEICSILKGFEVHGSHGNFANVSCQCLLSFHAYACFWSGCGALPKTLAQIVIQEGQSFMLGDQKGNFDRACFKILVEATTMQGEKTWQTVLPWDSLEQSASNYA